MAEKLFDVLVLGQLVGNDLLLAEHLSRKGLKCCVTRRMTSVSTVKEVIHNLPIYHTHFHESDIRWYRRRAEFLEVARESRLIVSFTGALINALGPLWFLRRFLTLPPVINMTTGSDITELAVESSAHGAIYRQYLRFVNLNWCATYPNAIKNILALRPPNVVFMLYPFHLSPSCITHNVDRQSSTVRFFHCSHLDWKVRDPGRHRNSSKGNDRFLRAFARAVKNGLDAECVILDRGSDRMVGKDLVGKLGVAERFIWKPELTPQELMVEFSQADVVVDQFDAGGLGGIAIEAMSLAKPVMIYIEENCRKLLYPEPVPVLNCHTESEIYEQIMRCGDRAYLKALGQQARIWATKYHNWETCLDQFLFYYALLTGHQVVDYGWTKNPYSE